MMKWSYNAVRLRSVWLLVPVFLILAEPTWRLMLVGGILAMIGGVIRGWAACTIRKNRILTTTGPYAYTRNPLYLGSFLVGLGVVVGSGSYWLLLVFVVFFTVVYSRTMRAEERHLEELFGEDFRRYAASVPLFIPGLRRYRGGDEQNALFDLRRYFGHREWELALGLTLAFLALWGKLELF
jgi:protein-S-isoprenylcysteine O-methyltransferase Ste14